MLWQIKEKVSSMKIYEKKKREIIDVITQSQREGIIILKMFTERRK